MTREEAELECRKIHNISYSYFERGWKQACISEHIELRRCQKILEETQELLRTLSEQRRP